MTLVLALKWLLETGEAVLVTSDSKATTGIGLAYEVRKTYPIGLDDGRPVAIASGAGDSALVKWGFDEAGRTLLSYTEKEYPLTFSSFRNAVRELEDRFIRRFAELRNHGLNVTFEMVLCGLDLAGKASIYLLGDRGLAEPMHDSPGYALLGCGSVTGGSLLLGLLPRSDPGMVSTFVIDSVSEIDTAVGPFVGESYLLRVVVENEEGKLAMGPLTPEAVVEYKENSRRRKRLIARLWELCDLRGEDEVEKALDSLNKEPQENG